MSRTVGQRAEVELARPWGPHRSLSRQPTPLRTGAARVRPGLAGTAWLADTAVPSSQALPDQTLPVRPAAKSVIGPKSPHLRAPRWKTFSTNTWKVPLVASPENGLPVVAPPNAQNPVVAPCPLGGFGLAGSRLAPMNRLRR